MNYLQAIYFNWHEPVYLWAGKLRKVDITKGFKSRHAAPLFGSTQNIRVDPQTLAINPWGIAITWPIINDL